MYEYGAVTDETTGEEFFYNSLQEREYIISGIVEQGHDYSDRVICVDCGGGYYG